MSSTFNRRAWLRTTALSGAALALLPSEIVAAAPASDRTKPIKLSGNENPYGFSPKAREAIVEALADGNRYANPDAVRELEALIAAREGLKPENVVLATGSGEILFMAAVAFGRAEIVAPDPTFPALTQYAGKLGAAIKSIPLNAKFEHGLDAMAKAITERTSIVYVCNPNNPTASITPNPTLTAFCREIAKPSEFPRNSMIELVRRARM